MLSVGVDRYVKCTYDANVVTVSQ